LLVLLVGASASSCASAMPMMKQDEIKAPPQE